MEVATERATSRTNDTASSSNTALVLAPAPAKPSKNHKNDATYAGALLRPVQCIITPVMDCFIPAPGRQDYEKIFHSIKASIYIYIVPFVVGLLLIAEYEQPGFLPRPDEISVAITGFLCICAIVFAAFALIEYDETHTWPWDDEGFVWPWQRWLWSCTVYDESIGDSVASYKDDYLDSVTSLFEEEGEDKEISVDFGKSGFEGRSDVQEPAQSTTTPDGSPARPDIDIIIPPTPCLPGGLRPNNLAPPPTHSSGLLGESPAPMRFKHFGIF
ncbi:hypothetical protein PtrSN002B_005757 [Pyrenophora tritici-repentis]|uniref:Uncharacterized protein n=1 Tax=Pyrenophora tritici-repentis TaxID=45151 RepID=A0A2W1FVP1_9PLEO|nr:hypothetical protein PtrV1_00210 [Pyrenophora tritici-repentis]KAF7452930.1 hypothetical protein A1F99_001880 [Pyrenophora tritici-repentis]KAF7575974.1 hypothetical protein PtrM4_002140 [Pyrenophora tritici-repentis]KAG9377663.1 hypothetical protein A1F94_012066 [Pyrenophora tritici-repentis]KAI0572957.1 hypothetical protein Alg130_10292 [Pyrenophora tritici-repentis]